MKYIKTKNNEIYKTVGEEELYWVVKDSDIYEKLVPRCNVIKQADTIEELFSRIVLNSCDFIILNKERTQYRFEGSDEWFDIIDTELRMGIYGTIWTDKGLIYVAKLNEKGEFELI